MTDLERRLTQLARELDWPPTPDLLSQLGAETLERTRHARLDRPARAVERRRRLLLGQLQEIAAGDRVARPVRQPLDRREELPAPLGAQERRLGRRDRVVRAALLGHAQHKSRAAARGPHAVPRLVGDDRQKPGPERRPVAEARQRAVRLDEGVLRGLLRVGVGSRYDPRGPERDRLMQSHDLLVGLQLTALRASDELRFMWWPVLHRARTTTRRRGSFQFLGAG